MVIIAMAQMRQGKIDPHLHLFLCPDNKWRSEILLILQQRQVFLCTFPPQYILIQQASISGCIFNSQLPEWQETFKADVLKSMTQTKQHR